MGAQPPGAAIGRLLPPSPGLSPGRPLTEGERRLAHEVFGPSLDAGAVRITRDSLLAVVSATSVCNRINLRSDHGHFAGDGLDLAPGMDATLVHELVHCWQYQHGGVAYMAESLRAQGLAMLLGRTRRGAYDWRAAEARGRPWHRWNPEQQAQCIEDWWQASRSGFRVTPAQHQAIALVRAGRGAARRSLAGGVAGVLLAAPPGALIGLAWGPDGALAGAAAAGLLLGLGLGVARPFRRR